MFRIKENKLSSKTNVQQINPPRNLSIKTKLPPQKLTPTPQPLTPPKIFLNIPQRQRHVLRQVTFPKKIELDNITNRITEQSIKITISNYKLSISRNIENSCSNY